MNREYSYRMQGGALLFSGFSLVFLFAMFVYILYTNKTADISVLEMFQDGENVFCFAISCLLSVMFIVLIKSYRSMKKGDTKFLLTDEGISFPPRPIFKKVITIPFDQIKSIERFSNRGVTTINIKTEVGKFSLPKDFFETSEIYDEVYNLIRDSISEN